MEDKVIINGVVLDNNDQDLINSAYIDQYGKLDYENPEFNARMDNLAKDYMGWKKGELDRNASKLVNTSWTDLKTQASPQYHNALKHLAGMPISSLDERFQYKIDLPEVTVSTKRKKPFIGPQEEEAPIGDTYDQGSFTRQQDEYKKSQGNALTYLNDFLAKASGKVWQGIGSLFSTVARAKAELQKNQESLEDYDPTEATEKVNVVEKEVFTKPGEKAKQIFIKDTEQVPVYDKKTGKISPKGFAQGASGLAAGIAPYLIPIRGIPAIVKDVKFGKFGDWGLNLATNFANNFSQQLPKVYFLTNGESLEQADKMGLTSEDAHNYAAANGLATTFAFSLPGSFLNVNPYNRTLAKFLLNPKNLSTVSQIGNFALGTAASGASGVLANVGEKVAKNLYAQDRNPVKDEEVQVITDDKKIVNTKVLEQYNDGTYKVEGIEQPVPRASIKALPEKYLSKEALQGYGESFLSMAALHGLMDYKSAGKIFKNSNTYYTNTVADMASPENFKNSIASIYSEFDAGLITKEQATKSISLLNKLQPYVADATVSAMNNPKFNKKYFGNYVFASAEREDLVKKRNEMAKDMSQTVSEGEDVKVLDQNGATIANNARVESISQSPSGDIQFKVEGIPNPVGAENIIPVRNTEAADKMNEISKQINAVSRSIRQIQNGNAFRGRLVTSNEVVEKASEFSPDGRLRPFQVRAMAEVPLGFFSENTNPLRFENDAVVKKHIKDIESGNLKLSDEEATMPIVVDEQGNIIDGKKRVAKAIVDARKGTLGNLDNPFEILRPVTFAEAANNISDLHDADPEVQRQKWDNMQVPSTEEAASALGMEELPVDLNLQQATSKLYSDTRQSIAEGTEDVTAEDVLDGNIEGTILDEATNTTQTAAEKVKAFMEYYNSLPESEKDKAIESFVRELNETTDANGRKVFGKNPEFEAFKASVEFLRRMGVPKEDLANALHNGLLPSYNDQGRVTGYINGALKIMEKKGLLNDDVTTFADIEAKRKAEEQEALDKKARGEKRDEAREMKLNQFAEKVASRGKLAFAKNKADQAYYERNKAEINKRAENVKKAKAQQAAKEKATAEGIEVVGQVKGKPTAEPVEEIKPTLEAEKADIEKRRKEELISVENRTPISEEIFEGDDMENEGEKVRIKITTNKDGSRTESIGRKGNLFGEGEGESWQKTQDISKDNNLTNEEWISKSWEGGAGENFKKVETATPKTPRIVEKINAKYDAELAALEGKKPTEKAKPTEEIKPTVEEVKPTEEENNLKKWKEWTKENPSYGNGIYEFDVDENTHVEVNYPKGIIKIEVNTGKGYGLGVYKDVVEKFPKKFDKEKGMFNTDEVLDKMDKRAAELMFSKKTYKYDPATKKIIEEAKPTEEVKPILEEVKPTEEPLVGANVLGKDASGKEVVGQVINEMANGDVIVKTDDGNVIIKKEDITDIDGETAVIPDDPTNATEFDPYAFESGMDYETEEETYPGGKPEYTPKAKEAEFTREENMKDVKDLFDQLRNLGKLESKGKDCL